MPDVNEQIAKEFFELKGFLVASNVAFPVTTNEVNQNSDFDLVVRNLAPKKYVGKIPFVLDSETVKSIEAAVVEVKGWHTTRLTPGYVKEGSTPRAGILKFVNRRARKNAREATGAKNPRAILIVSELAKTPEVRDETEGILRSDGVNHILLFDEILRSLIKSVDTKRHYAHSATLHVLRLLKNYKMLK